ncbi:MAG: pilus assembly protein TadG-related protein [Acidimicrobiales bacterium]
MLPLVALVVVAAAGAALVVAALGGVVIDRTRARTAADAAALAGVTGGRDRAEQVARANGGALRRFVQVDGAVEVTVRVGRAEATARARAGAPRRQSRRPGLVDSLGDDRAPAHRRARDGPLGTVGPGSAAGRAVARAVDVELWCCSGRAGRSAG